MFDKHMRALVTSLLNDKFHGHRSRFDAGTIELAKHIWRVKAKTEAAGELWPHNNASFNESMEAVAKHLPGVFDTDLRSLTALGRTVLDMIQVEVVFVRIPDEGEVKDLLKKHSVPDGSIPVYVFGECGGPDFRRADLNTHQCLGTLESISEYLGFLVAKELAEDSSCPNPSDGMLLNMLEVEIAGPHDFELAKLVNRFEISAYQHLDNPTFSIGEHDE